MKTVLSNICFLSFTKKKSSITKLAHFGHCFTTWRGHLLLLRTTPPRARVFRSLTRTKAVFYRGNFSLLEIFCLPVGRARDPPGGRGGANGSAIYPLARSAPRRTRAHLDLFKACRFFTLEIFRPKNFLTGPSGDKAASISFQMALSRNFSVEKCPG